MVVSLQIDITIDDKVKLSEMAYFFDVTFEECSINVFVYTV